jgi:voltage-gated sodium channel
LIFVLELLLRITGDPLRPWLFFIGRSWRWNLFDLAVVIMCAPSLGIEYAPALRVLRLLRLLKLLSKNPRLAAILKGLAAGVRSSITIFVLMILVFYMFGVGGLIFFAASDPKHFGTFGASVVTLFRVSTSEDWTDVMYANYYGCDVYSNGGGHYYLTLAEVKATRTSAGGSGYLDTLNRTEASDLGAHKFYAPCGLGHQMPVTSYIFFHTFMVVMSLVVLSMFVGAVAIAMTGAMAEAKRAEGERVKAYIAAKRETGKQSKREQRMKAKMDVRAIDTKPLADRMRFHNIKMQLRHGIERKFPRDNFIEQEIAKVDGCAKGYFMIGYACRIIARTQWFQFAIAGVIIVAGLLVGLQTDGVIGESGYIDRIIVLIFCGEFLFKIVGEIFEPWVYFHDSWNRFDFFVVVCGFLPIGGYVVVLRCVRLLRVLKLVSMCPPLQVLVSALTNSFGSIRWIGVLLLIFLYGCSVFAITLFGENDPWHFGNLHLAMMTLFRVSTLENWSDVMYISQYGCNNVDSFPYNRYPELCTKPQAWGTWAPLFFICFVIMANYILLSLFIGIIAAEMETVQRQQSELHRLRKSIQEYAHEHHLPAVSIEAYEKAFNNLDELRPSGGMDPDDLQVGLHLLGSKFVSSQEEFEAHFDHCSSLSGESYELDLYGFTVFMWTAPWIEHATYHPNPVFTILSRMLTRHAAAKERLQIGDETEKERRILGPDRSPNQLSELNCYSRMCYHCAQLDAMASFDNFMIGVVVFAGVLIGLETGYHMEDSEVIAALDIIVLILYTFEILIKMLSFEWQPWRFFFEKDKVFWNNFDFIIALLSMPGAFAAGPALRLLRLARVVKLFEKVPKLKVIVVGLMAGLKSVVYILVLLLIVFYIYAVLGVSLFAVNDPWHFRSMKYALETLYTLASLEGWTSIWYTNYFGCDFHSMDVYVTAATLAENLGDDGKLSPDLWMCTPQSQPIVSSLFFVSFIWIASFIMLSLFVGSILISTMDAVMVIAEEVSQTLGALLLLCCCCLVLALSPLLLPLPMLRIIVPLLLLFLYCRCCKR